MNNKADKVANRMALIFSVCALVCVLTGAGAMAVGIRLITGSQIKNGTVSTRDLKNNNVSSSDLKNNTIDSVDIGANEVRPSDVQMPAPAEMTPPGVAAAVTPQFTKIYEAGIYTKQTAESVLEISWNGAVASGSATNCVFQVRVNGKESTGGGGEVFALGQPSNVSTTGLFPGIAAEDVHIEVWAKQTATASTEPLCIIGPSNPGIDNTFIANESVTG